MTKAAPHKWQFKARFRRHAFGWKSQPAIQRVKEAVAEIKKVARKDPVLAADGAVALLERLSPALEHVDSSSGSIGTAVNNAIAALVPLITLRQPQGKGLSSLLHSVVTPSSGSVLQFAVTVGAAPVLIQLDNNQDQPVELHRVELSWAPRW